MKKFFAIYIFTLCLYPVLANSWFSCSTYNNNRASCLALGGCMFNSFASPTTCDECGTNQYNPQQSSCNDEDNDHCNETCQTIPDGNYKNDAGTGYLSCPTQNITIPANTTDTLNIGNCTCGNNRILIKTTENSIDKYYCGSCNHGTAQSETGNINTCTCATTTNHVYGQTSDMNNMLTECACPDNATWNGTQCVCDDPNKSLTLDSTTNKYVCSSCTSPYATNNGGTCICNAGYYGNPVGLNTVCHACPTNSTSVVNGVANAAGATSIDQCKCDQNHPIRSTNPTTGAVTCSACPSNATSYTTGTDFEYECKCDANYYGNGYILCTQCPAGTTKAVGGSSGSNGRQAPTTQSDCKFSSNTRFCVPSTTRTVDNSGYVCFTPTNITYTY